MKTLMVVLFSLSFLLTALAQDVKFSAEKKSLIVDNLTIGIKYDNSGLNASSADVLFNLINEKYLESSDASRTLIPLLRLLDKSHNEEVRIAAALALYKLGNSIGIFRLKCVAKSDDNEKLRTICKNLYYTYHKLNGSEYYIDFWKAGEKI